MKVCKKCGEKFEIVCKPCENKRHRENYKNNTSYQERKKREKAKYNDRNREYVYNFLLENPCTDCGETDPIVLEFDHLHDKVKSVSDMMANCSLSRIKEEISKCVVRCANCHRRKTAKTHGYYASIGK